MGEPLFSVTWSAQRSGSSPVTRGNLLVPSESDPRYFVVATSANRNGRRCSAIALESHTGSTPGRIAIQQSGTISAELSGLEAGAQTWACCTADGAIDRIVGTPTSDDDIIGLAEEDGSVHLLFGILTADIVNGSGGGGGTVPTGTGFATVTSGAWDAAATANIRYASGKLQTDANIQWKNGGSSTGDLAWTPTGIRTLTLPDATDTLVGRATTDTLTNKTINGSNNTITNVSLSTGVTGTLPLANLATSPTAGAVLQTDGIANSFGLIGNANVSASAAIAASKIAPPGSAGQLVYNNSGALAGTANFTIGGGSGAGIIGNTSAFVSFGTNPAAAGMVRFPYNASAQTFASMRDNGNTADWNILGATGPTLTISDSNLDTVLRGFGILISAANGSGGIDFAAGGQYTLRPTSSAVNVAQPLAGDQRAPVPFRFKSASITQSTTTTTTLTSAQAECPLLLFTGTPGGSFDVRAPSVADAFFIVVNGTGSQMTFKPASGGTGVIIATGKTAQVRCNTAATDYVRVTLDA